MRMWLRLRISRALVFGFLLLTLWPLHSVLARGGSYHGGGFHGGGRFSTGYHYGGRTYYSCASIPDPVAMANCNRRGRVSFYLCMGIVALLFLFRVSRMRQGWGGKPKIQGKIWPESEYQLKAEETESALHELSKTVSYYEPQSLRALVTKAFFTLQRTWALRDYREMSALVTTSLKNDHLLMLDAMRRNHEINRIENVEIKSLRFVHIDHVPEKHFECLTVMILAEAVDYYEDDRSGNWLRGNRNAADFQEFWKFRYTEGQWLLAAIEQASEANGIREPNRLTSGHGTSTLVG